jgi:hypothetical protein
MKIKLKKIDRLSGDCASIYSFYIEDSDKSQFELFLDANNVLFRNELSDIVRRIKTIGNKTGANECFFKTKEGAPGDLVCALYDNPKRRLRLYCLRYGKMLIIVGGGGEKPKNIHTLQENDKLKEENYLLRKVSTALLNEMKDKNIRFSKDGMEIECDYDIIEFEI